MVREEGELEYWRPHVTLPDPREQTFFEADTLRLVKPRSSLQA